MICAGVSDEDLGEVRPMKNLWKRTLSLVLSGVLLLGSVPMDVFAEEETTAPVETTVVETQPIETEPAQTQPEETQPTVTETQPATEPVVQVITDDVADEGLDENELPLLVNGESITSDWNDGAYNADENQVTLNGGTVGSIEGIKEELLTIELVQDKTTTISGALKAVEGIRITGTGTLIVESIHAGKNLEIVDAVVKVGADKGESEDRKTLIAVKNEICVSGEGHLITSVGHKAVAFTDETEGAVAKIQGEGYFRTGQSGDFVEILSDTTVDKDLEYFEAVGADHVEDANVHVTSCKCAEDTNVTLILGNHTPEYSFEEGSNEITAKCGNSGCNRDLEPVKITVPTDLTWNGEEKVISVNAEDYEVHYEVVGGENKTSTLLEENQEPVDSGTYRAVATVKLKEQEYMLQAVFTIAAKTLTDGMVSISKTLVDYDGTSKTLPTVTVKDGETTLRENTHYTVVFKREEEIITNGSEKLIDAGDISVIVTGMGNYGGTVQKTFTIGKAEANADMFDYTQPAELIYSGDAKVATLKPKNTVMGMGETEIRYYKKGVAEASQPIDAGEYEVRVYVKGTENYAAGEISNADNWKFTIMAAEADLTVHNQIIAGGSKGGDFVEPKYTVNGKEVPGTFTYSFNEKQNLAYAGARDALKLVTSAEPVNISFKFVPSADKADNYKDLENFTETFAVTLKTLNFKIDSENDIQDQDLKASDLSYGVEEPIRTNTIKAFANDVEITTTGYTVTFKQNGNEVKTRPLPAGRYSFDITYTGRIGGIQCLDYMVHSGTVEIAPKKIRIETPYVAQHLTVKKDTEGKTELQALLTGEAVTDVTAEGIYEWVYQVTGKGERKEIPQEKDLGVYELKYYAKSKDTNYSDSDTTTVDIAILPVLEADYGKYLKDIDLTGTGFEWNKDKNDPETTLVGNVDDSDVQRTFVLKHKATPVRDEIKAVVTVNPIVVTEPVVTPKTKYVFYAEEPEIELIVKASSESADPIPATEYTVVPGTEPETKTGELTVSVVDKENGNYTVGNGSTTVIQYRPAYMTLSKVPDSLEETDFNSLEKIKTELSSEIEDETYPTSVMKYYEIAMSKYGDKTGGGKGWVIVRDEEAFPDTGTDGGFSVTIPYSSLGTGIDKNKVDFKVVIMDADTVERLGIDATKGAKIIEAHEEDKGITFHSDGYSIVCIARQVDPEQKFDIKKSIVLDGSSSKKGELAFKVDSVTVDKTNFGKTVTVTATKNTGYSIEKVTAVTDGGDTVTLTKKAEGSYEFKMPADHVTVKLSLKKTTSTSKNPSSGDTSNIQLWVTVLAASGAAIGVLMVFWLKKRKK